jgi:CHASE2 domain-containing sensor protein
MIDRLTAMGAKAIYFDEAFSIPGDEQGDQAFADALARNRGKVFLGAVFSRSRTSDKDFVTLPQARFRAIAPVRSLHGKGAAFSLSTNLSYADESNGETFRSMSSDIAGLSGAVGTSYRPDWSIKVDSIPTVSMIDLLGGKVPSSAFRNKVVIVGVTTLSEPDVFQIVGQGWLPGVYAHVVGAQTLREGRPIDLGWLPPLMLAAVMSIGLLRTKSKRRANTIMLGFLGAAAVVPFLLDAQFIGVSLLPAFILFGVVAYRSATLRELSEARLRNAGTLFPNLSALREEPLAAQRPIIAMRIRNYAAVCASFATSVEDELITEPGDLILPGRRRDLLAWPVADRAGTAGAFDRPGQTDRKPVQHPTPQGRYPYRVRGRCRARPLGV